MRECRVDAEKWATGLLKWRNTPRSNGLSSAQVVFGHAARDTLPVHKRAFAPEWQKFIKEADEKEEIDKDKHIERYNSSSKPLPCLDVGTHVAVQEMVTKKWN